MGIFVALENISEFLTGEEVTGALVHICRTVVNSPIDGVRDDGFSERLSKINVLSDGSARRIRYDYCKLQPNYMHKSRIRCGKVLSVYGLPMKCRLVVHLPVCSNGIGAHLWKCVVSTLMHI